MSATAVSHSERLALRLLQNWTAMHPSDPSTTSTSGSGTSPGTPAGSHAVVDDSLTSLTWLQNLNVMKLAPGSSPNAAGRTSTSGSGGHVTTNRPTGAVQPIQQQQQQQRKMLPHVDPNAILDMTGGSSSSRVKSEPASPSSHSPPLPRLSPPPPPRCGDTGEQSPPLPALQRTDGPVKPQHSYATLICMAMNDAPDQRVTLSNIYSWILDNFPYFRTVDPSWQNSIRHNLSLNKCFQRVQRKKSDPGKGSYWTFNPEFQTIVDRDFFRKRPATSTSSSHASKKACRRSTVDEGPRATSTSAAPSSRRGSTSVNPATNADEFLHDLNADDGDSLTDVFDMSWSTILGRSISCPGEVDHAAAQSGTTEPRQQRAEVTAVGGSPSGSRSATDNDAELDELIRACADTDPGILDDLGDFSSLDSDSLDLTIYGVGLRPPDWWSSLCDSFDSASTTGGEQATTRRDGLNTPSPGGPSTHDRQDTRRQQQQQHPWAENRCPATITSLDSSLDDLGLLPPGSPTPFDSDVADEF